MSHLLALLSLLWLAGPPVPKGVPPPPGGSLDAELTQTALDRARAEAGTLLEQMEASGQPAAQKAEIRRRFAGLRIAIYTTPKGWEETVAFYEGSAMRLTFLKGERDILGDLREAARAAGFAVPPDAEKAWAGKVGRTARWTKDDDTLQVVVEDHLIDPRDGKVTPMTVVLVTSLGS